MCLVWAPATRRMPIRMATITEAVPRSGWARVSAHRDGGDDQGDHEPVERQAVGPLAAAEVRGQDQDQRDLGELRRLELEAAHLEPRHGALAGLPDEQQGHEAEGGGGVEPRSQVPPASVVDGQHREHAHQADGEGDALALDEEVGVEAVERLGLVAGAVDGQQADGGQADDRREQEPVDVLARVVRVAPQRLDLRPGQRGGHVSRSPAVGGFTRHDVSLTGGSTAALVAACLSRGSDSTGSAIGR